MAEATILSREELKTLAQVEGTPAVSIYFPTVKAAVESHENSLHLKNLLAEADERLGADLRRPQVEDLLAPARELLDDTDFWLHQERGLALFRSQDFFRYYKLPFEVEESVTVQDRLYTKPLLSGLTESGTFYILGLALGGIRLLRCDAVGAEEIDLANEGIPLNLDQALRWDDLPDRATPDSPGATAGSGVSPHHGRSTGDERGDQIRRFFQAIDPAISKILLREHAPLVLAGVEHERARYRQISSYRRILNEGVDGNPEGLRAEELREKAWPAARTELRKPLLEAFERYGTLQARGQASCDLEHCLTAARDGRVETLFLLKGAEQRGRFDETVGSIRAGADDSRAVDLLDVAANQTLLTGGEVYLVDPAEMPCDGDVAAIYRY
jgi:hypothetical protein